jgi:hypothetical protein
LATANLSHAARKRTKQTYGMAFVHATSDTTQQSGLYLNNHTLFQREKEGGTALRPYTASLEIISGLLMKFFF